MTSASPTRSAVKLFGVDRCMMASDFSTGRLQGSFKRQFEADAAITADLNEAERDAVFADTAERGFRLA